MFGDGGDDWIQGGSGQDLLQGDHGAPFFDDPAETTPGNDIFIGQVGENDYDAEGGDDVMSQNAAVDRNAGAGGFDWAIHQYDTVGADDDMKINQQLAGLPIQVVVNRDRWQETEADSGSTFNDVIRGDDMRARSGRRRLHRLRRPRPGRRRPHRRARQLRDDVPDAAAADVRRIAAAGTARSSAAEHRRPVAERLGRGQHPARRWRQRPHRGSWQRRHHRRRPRPARRDPRADQPGQPGHRDRQDRPDGEHGDVRATSVPARPA